MTHERRYKITIRKPDGEIWACQQFHPSWSWAKRSAVRVAEYEFGVDATVEAVTLEAITQEEWLQLHSHFKCYLEDGRPAVLDLSDVGTVLCPVLIMNGGEDKAHPRNSVYLYASLALCVLTDEQHQRTCNYWYTVTSNETSHSAFTTESELLTWLQERGLELTKPLTLPGDHSFQHIAGVYRIESHWAWGTFNDLTPILTTRTLSNGQWTLAKITENDGIRTVHALNPNVRDRPVFDGRERDIQWRKLRRCNHD